MPNWYAGRTTLKAQLGITDTSDDTTIDRTLNTVSRWIEAYCGTWFYPATQTRYFTARFADHLMVTDLLAVTSLATDDGDRTYGTSWASTDYDLYPYDAAQQSPPEPYWQINTTPEGSYSFDTVDKGVKVIGKWGRYDQRTTSTATLNEALDTSETGVDVTSGTVFEVGQTILIDSEQMFISAISSNTLTVTRAVNGTTAATHSSSTAIQVYEYPIVTEACLIQCGRIFKRKDSPYGIAGSPEFGMVRIARLDPDVQSMLSQFRNRALA